MYPRFWALPRPDFIKMERISVYIDGANFYYGLKTINKRYSDVFFDFASFVREIIGKEKLITTYYYNAPLKENLNKYVYWNREIKENS